MTNKKESKRELFVRVAELRTQKVLDDLKKLSKCANPACYEYSERDLERIFTAIEKEIQFTRDTLAGRTRFSLSECKRSEKTCNT